MNAKFLRATTDDKLILQGLLYMPEKAAERVILHIHGMSGNFYENRFLDAMAEEFTNKGWAFLVPNTRGHDYIADFPIDGPQEKSVRIGNYREIFEDCLKDLKTWMDAAEAQGFKKIVLQGHSLGAVKAAYYLAKTQDKRIGKLILASPPDMVALGEQEKQHKQKLELAKKMTDEGEADEIMPGKVWDWYHLTPQTYLNFFQRGNEIDVFNTYDKQKPSKTLQAIKIPTLGFCGSKDDANIYLAEESMQVIKQKTPNVPVFDIKVVEGAPHSYFGHEKEVAELITTWLAQ
jgi:alpha-beta hydrolase superfamily lysophospholipase